MSTCCQNLSCNDALVVSSGVVVRPIRDDVELEIVHRLTYLAYHDCGLIGEQTDGRLVYCSHLELIPETTVLVAVEGQVIVGTL